MHSEKLISLRVKKKKIFWYKPQKKKKLINIK
jgi:hypothetical protein